MASGRRGFAGGNGRAIAVGLLALVVVVVAIVLLTGEDSGGEGGASSDSATLVVDLIPRSTTTLDPHNESHRFSRIVNHARFSTLMTFEGSDTRTPVPALATRYEASPDGKVFTFHLREGARFADGTPLTSEDVVFSLTRAVKYNNGGGDAAASFPAGVTFEANGPSTVIVRNNQPNPGTPYTLTMPLMSILNSKLAKKNGATDTGKNDKAARWLSSPASRGASSGPYTMTSYTRERELVLTRNENYWGEKPDYKKIVVRNVPAQAQVLQVQRGDDELALDIGANDAQKLKDNPGLEVSTGASADAIAFYLNKNPKISAATSNPKLEQAVRLAIDYERLAKLAGPGAVIPSSVLPQSIYGSLPATDQFHQNTERAKQLYADSGVTEAIEFNYGTDSTVSGVATSVIAQSVKADLDAAGIKAEIIGKPIATVFEQAFVEQKLGSAYFPAYPARPTVDELAGYLPGGFLAPMAGYAPTYDPKLAALAKRALAEPDYEKRVKLYQQAQRMLNESGPWYPVVSPANVFVSTSSVGLPEYNPTWVVDLASVGPTT